MCSSDLPESMDCETGMIFVNAGECFAVVYYVDLNFIPIVSVDFTGNTAFRLIDADGMCDTRNDDNFDSKANMLSLKETFMKKNLSKKCERLVGKCCTISQGSNHPNHHLGAVIVKSGRILASGYNRVGQHNSNSYRKFADSIHAEQDAIRTLLVRPDLLFGASVYFLFA